MSANFYSGYSPEKPTSRVLAPPGGASHNIFGGSAAPSNDHYNSNQHANGHSQQQQQQNAKPELTPSQQAAANKYHNTHGTNIFGNEIEHSSAGQGKDHQSQQRGNDAAGMKSRQRGSYNPITGQTYEDEDNEREKIKQNHMQHQVGGGPQQQQKQQPQHTSTRVHQPPGGQSSKLW